MAFESGNIIKQCLKYYYVPKVKSHQLLTKGKISIERLLDLMQVTNSGILRQLLYGTSLCTIFITFELLETR